MTKTIQGYGIRGLGPWRRPWM